MALRSIIAHHGRRCARFPGDIPHTVHGRLDEVVGIELSYSQKIFVGHEAAGPQVPGVGPAGRGVMLCLPPAPMVPFMGPRIRRGGLRIVWSYERR